MTPSGVRVGDLLDMKTFWRCFGTHGCHFGADVFGLVAGVLLGVCLLWPRPAWAVEATSSRVAMQGIRADLSVAPRAGYVWTRSYCLRYRSGHPNLLILGDSIFDGWSGYLLHVFPLAVIDARVGRQFASAVPLYRRLRTYPGIRAIRTIVVELGTNGPVTAGQVDRFMAMAGNRRVIFIVPEVPRPWENEVQSLYESLPMEYPNVELEHWDWIASLPDGQENMAYFWGDGVHPDWDGIKALVAGLESVLSS